MENFFRYFKLNIKDFYKNTWLNKKDLVNLNKKGHMIGMHSFSHPYRMSSLTKKKQKPLEPEVQKEKLKNLREQLDL